MDWWLAMSLWQKKKKQSGKVNTWCDKVIQDLIQVEFIIFYN